MKGLALDIMNLMTHLVRTDNEEMGVICVKVIIDLNRTFRAVLDPHIQPLVALVNDMYNSMPDLVEKTFGKSTSVLNSSSAENVAPMNGPLEVCSLVTEVLFVYSTYSVL